MTRETMVHNLGILVAAMAVAESDSMESALECMETAPQRAVQIWEAIAAKHCKDWRTADKLQQAHILRDVLHRAYVLVSDKLAGRN